eukprot:756571-Hanusia_phi.AAC.4
MVPFKQVFRNGNSIDLVFTQRGEAHFHAFLLECSKALEEHWDAVPSEALDIVVSACHSAATFCTKLRGQ